ncbi:MAG: PHP domain-containing protein [Flavobacteriaceae bacterium]|nr:PHP domain-containing protein [Flavobacteriaceae bacterium]
MYLNTHSYYSLRYGTMLPETLLKQSQQMGVSAMALTDINSTSASLDFVRLAEKYKGLGSILGVDFRNGVQQRFVMLAENNHGFYQLNRYLSALLHADRFFVPERAPQLENTFVIYPFQKEEFSLCENEFIGVRPADINQLKFSKWYACQEKLVLLKTVSFLLIIKRRITHTAYCGLSITIPC